MIVVGQPRLPAYEARHATPAGKVGRHYATKEQKMDKINFSEKFNLFSEQWSPKIIAQLNDYHFKLVRIKGDFTLHKHDDTDEAFIVLDGEMRMDYENGRVTLKKGEMIVVPKGTIHKPYAEKEAKLLVIEPAGTLNTGDKKDLFTKEKIEWI
jgi:mannose-6-phosphate isomerase-like protein (cupin superfamily)